MACPLMGHLQGFTLNIKLAITSPCVEATYHVPPSLSHPRWHHKLLALKKPLYLVKLHLKNLSDIPQLTKQSPYHHLTLIKSCPRASTWLTHILLPGAKCYQWQVLICLSALLLAHRHSPNHSIISCDSFISNMRPCAIHRSGPCLLICNHPGTAPPRDSPTDQDALNNKPPGPEAAKFYSPKYSEMLGFFLN